MNGLAVGTSKWEIDTPALCLDTVALEGNIRRMADYFRDRPAALRPHCKTHKCPVIAWMQLRAGAIGITCAKLSEAEVMAQAGIQDILIANQVVGPSKIERLVSLAGYTKVMVAIDSAENASALSAAAQSKGIRLRALMEVDVGMGRCGVAPGQPSLSQATHLASLQGLRFEGIMGYEGHAVAIPDFDERRRMAEAAMADLVATRDLLERNGINVGIVSAGGTGTYSITGNYDGITEIQAGSYATMDAKYQQVGIDFDLALTIVSQVVSTPVPDVAIIDAGAKSATTEFGMPRLIRPEGWYLLKFSEEHGHLRRQGGKPLHIGDMVELVPSHGCTTINLYDAFQVIRNGIVEAVWPVAARGCSR